MCSLVSRVYARCSYTDPAVKPRPEILQSVPAMGYANPHPWGVGKKKEP